ncbi:hypothetical protein [Ralstonia flaminis]|jgi:hypothetical protein|uniref:Uncharacterized protein n=1 Tax=Ralstonia flaminis TaxID=3058597 RepID=A0ABN9JY29_9RALS|nr:hypothetical protein [Ralstonia sp. LMG 18101]CAJ0822884.1 hypothetical protein LMG18101_05240 [Ralstonia sp. LMG 18101]
MGYEQHVASLKVPNQILVTGFEACDSAAHMIEWLGRGKDFRTFVIHDIEGELYAQDRASQLLAVHCKMPPVLETKVRQGATGEGIVTGLLVTFPVTLKVSSGDGQRWVLDVMHGYRASDLDVAEKFQLRMDFTVEGSQLES